MASIMNRVMVSMPEEIENEIKQLRQSQFYNMPYTELYRQILRLGLNKIAKQLDKTQNKA